MLASFASFGFCKAHAAAFALPTYQSAWLKTHHPAAFLAGVLTHDPGMYPRRLILDDARSLGIAVLPLDVNASGDTYRVERLEPGPTGAGDPVGPGGRPAHPDLPDGSAYGIRLSLTDVMGIGEDEVVRIVAGQPFADLGDFWTRARVSRPVLERLVLAGAFDGLYGMGGSGRRSRPPGPGDPARHPPPRRRARPLGGSVRGRRGSVRGPSRGALADLPGPRPARPRPRGPPRAHRRNRAARDDRSGAGQAPSSTSSASTRAGTSWSSTPRSSHALGVVRSRDLLRTRSRSEVWVAGVKVATQTPPVRSGRRVVFLTLDDGTGPADLTFFEDVQGPYAATVFHSWLVLARGVVRRTGERGVSLRATGAWELLRGSGMPG